MHTIIEGCSYENPMDFPFESDKHLEQNQMNSFFFLDLMLLNHNFLTGFSKFVSPRNSFFITGRNASATRNRRLFETLDTAKRGSISSEALKSTVAGGGIMGINY